MKAKQHSEILLKSLTIYGVLLTYASLSVGADNAISDQPDLAKSTPVSIVTTISSTTENGVTSQNELESSTLDTFPPSIFPEDQVEVNETARKILLGFDNKTTVELNVNEESTTPQMSLETSSLSSSDEPLSNNTSSSTTETFESDYDNVSNESENTDAENIQDNSGESQENEEENYGFRVNGTTEAEIKVFQNPVPTIHSGHYAMIFALTLAGFSVIIYVGLVIWRSQLERRYGMRQRLVTEDVFYSDNQNDVRYFGL